MKKIKVLFKNSYELELKEKGSVGDIIDLRDSIEINLDELGKNYQEEQLAQIQSSLQQKYEEQIKELRHQHEKEKMLLEHNKEQEIFQLQLKRANFNIKLVGENLEQWCDNEVQNQLLIANDITWIKDNQIINNAKGDFIYKLHFNAEKKDDQILTSALLEMKSEVKNNLSSPTKKRKNEQYFKKLDQDRQNKNLEFALLVSELEYEQENDIPVKKVPEYENMFIIRPAYLVVFLNIITALGRKHKELIMNDFQAKQEFKKEQEIKDDFQAMKNEILDHSFKNIENNLMTIQKENENIKKISDSLFVSYEIIQTKINTILERHFKTVLNKINNFKIDQIIKKINHLEE
ncbi:DUF2130 domain-containing protein [Candidatus Phytoplasma pruni]|uniref:DUF2130 domain-containing protein n=1 Tax=Candidatus Phytoplasma pruni TaxID=479893 RepID=A0A851H985_9MOLU|nr:DUF2130 domain-containing protein [Candidatus Phytoplasma pruni]NWN45482.1 DUF2130 domain-containing protein [Candidatus Phytoplasma pruni]